jgi:exonuclease SbcD
MEEITLIHTADVHLGREFRSLGKKGKLFRERLAWALSTAADEAVSNNVQLFLIAGDLFDSNRVSTRTLEQVEGILAKLTQAGIKVFLIPGTHDRWGEDCILHKGFFAKAPPGIFILTPDAPVKILPELDCALCGWFPHPDRPEHIIIPPEGWHQGMRFKIGMAHGSILIREQIQDRMMPIPPQLIRDSGLDYLALGHWHNFFDVTQGDVPAAYSGSPEMLEVDQKNAGRVVWVRLHGHREMDLKTIQVGKIEYKELVLQAGELAAGKSLFREIEQLRNPDLWLRVIITGEARPDFQLDLEEIREEFEGGFFKLDMVDQSVPLLHEEELKGLSPNTVAGEFARIMKERMESAEDEKREILEEALRLGLSRLRRGVQRL